MSATSQRLLTFLLPRKESYEVAMLVKSPSHMRGHADSSGQTPAFKAHVSAEASRRS